MRFLTRMTLAGMAAFAAGAAQADTIVPISWTQDLVLSQSWASTAAGQTPTTSTGSGVNGDGAGVQISDLTGNGPGTYLFSKGYTSSLGAFPAAGGGIAANGGLPYGFTDSYVIDVLPSMANAYVFSLNLSSTVGISNLTARLYEYNANGITNLTLGTTGPLSSGTLDAWSASSNASGSNPVASTTLAATNLSNGGEFVLEVAGIETGSSNGTFSGQLNVQPVPLPAALPLLFSGLASIGVWARRRSSRAA